MSKSIADADLVAMAKVTPELEELRETDSEWSLGRFGVDTMSSYQGRASWTWPRWRDGDSKLVTASMHLRVQRFVRDTGERAAGVVLAVPEDDTEQCIGWVSEGHADQVSAWVELLNREIVALWSHWDAAGRPMRLEPAPAPPTPAQRGPDWGRDDRVGRRLANGRFEVTEWFGMDSYMGAAIARDHEHGDLVRLYFSRDVAGSVADVRALLARDVPGLAPVVFVGDTTSDDDWGRGAMMLAERLPAGAVELALPSGLDHGRDLAAIGARLAGHLLGVHRGGMVLGTLRPESTFVTATGELVLLARGERLWLMPRPNVMKPCVVPPWRYGYHAPEIFHLGALLRDPAPAADVFSLAVMLGSALLGEFVYRADDVTSLVVAQLHGTHLPLPDTSLGRILTRCLRRDPVARPSLEEVEKALVRQPD